MGDTRTHSAIGGYAHVNILVTDLEVAAAFYEGTLGLERLPRPDFGSFGGLWYRLGPSQLHLSLVQQMPDWRGGAPHLALYIDPDDFVATVQSFVDAGAELTSEIRSREDFGVPVQTAFCCDPFGNLIEMTDVALFG
jgi:glyoxylase I family protein